MKARAALLWLAAMLAAALVLPAAGAAKSVPLPAAPPAASGQEEVHAYFNFEQQLTPWEAVTDSPYHAYKFAQMSGSNGCPDLLGNHFARLMTAVKSGLTMSPPTKYATWVLANFEVAGKGTRLVTVLWSARWSPHYNGEPAPKYDGVVAFAGINPPTRGVELTRPANSYLTFNWQTYKYQTYIDLSPIGEGITTPVAVALGWDNVGDSVDLDCVDVSITNPGTSR